MSGLFVPGSSGYVDPAYVVGNWIRPYPEMSLGAGSASANTAIYLAPIKIVAPITIAGLGCRISTLSASGNAMIGIYAHNPATGRPTGAVLASVTGLSTTTATIVSSTLSGPTLAPGLYWAGGEMDNATSAFESFNSGVVWMAANPGSATIGNVSAGSGSAGLGLSVTNTYGTFPNLTSASFSELTFYRAPAIFIKAG